MSYRRYVALGDSFTEGVGDPDPDRPNEVRGWADRVAEVLCAQDPSFGYANLAIRGRKLFGIADEQLEPALALQPDLVTIHGGVNDVLRPRIDMDALAARYDEVVGALRAAGAQVVMFTTFDPGKYKPYSMLRGRMAHFNETVREICDAHDTLLVDIWRMRDPVDEVLSVDRMHLNARGHQRMAIAVLDTLGVSHQLTLWDPEPRPVLSPRERRQANAQWTREHLGPWIGRRLTGRSSGDTISPRYPTFDRI